MKYTLRRLLLACAIASSASLLLATTVPSAMNYQGFLTDDAGVPIGNSTAENRNLEFRLYKQKDGGTPAWGEAQIVTIFKGSFSVILGSGTPLSDALTSGEAAFASLFASTEAADLYIGIKPVGGEEFSPRQKLLSSAFALHAKTADNIVQAANTQASLSNLVMNGGTQVSGNNVIQFGSGISTKQADAGTIGYQKLSTDGLDIVGAGTTNTNRKIVLWAEGGTSFTGPITVAGSVSRTGHGVFIGSAGDAHSFGSQDFTTFARTGKSFAFYLGGAWTTTERSPGVGGTTLAYLDVNGLDLRSGKFSGDGSGLTNIGGAGLGVNGSNVLEFGKGVAKQVDNGRIGYGTYSSGTALDIVGAGTASNGSDRKINLHAQGGVRILGSATVDSGASFGGLVSANAGANVSGALGIIDSSVNFGFRLGQLINLYGGSYGIGIQGNTQYYRTDGGFAWFKGGTHSNDVYVSGGGSTLATLDSGAFGVNVPLNANYNVSTPILYTSSNGIVINPAAGGAPAWNIAHQGGFSANNRLIFYLGGQVRLLVEATGSQNIGSDLKLKKDIAPVTSALDTVMKLQPKAYRYKEERDDAQKSYGFIAQEVQPVLPDLVKHMDEDTLGLNYDGFIPVTVAAVQEQQKKIETLNTENEALKKRLEDLEARFSKLAERLPEAPATEAKDAQ